MTQEAKTLKDLDQTVEAQAEPRVQKLDKQGRAYATGRRKESVARVWIKPGSGAVVVNGLDIAAYFKRPTLQMLVRHPLKAVDRDTQFDVVCQVSGGGLSGQAGAVSHGLSRALDNYEPTLHKTLRSNGFLTRDDRKVERKKYGRKKARKSFQFSKR